MKAVLIWVLCWAGSLPAQQIPSPGSVPPRAWDTRALSDWATPLANVNIRPGHFSEDEYYRAPIDNCRTYPVYLPGREPAGYWDALQKKRPEPLFEIGKPGLTFNWIPLGKHVWDEIDVPFFRLYDAESISMARSAEYMRKNRDRIVILADGTSAIYRWVVTQRGIALGVTACSSCHTRVLDDGTTLAGPGLARLTSDPLLDRMLNRLLRTSYTGDGPQLAAYRQFGVPWLADDIHLKLKTLSDDGMARLFAAQVPGVTDRPNGSPYYITKIPDLIGIRDRKYIDHTATHQHRGPGDLMRYAALVEYSDSMDFGSHRMLSERPEENSRSVAG
jgi:hypothetical protein